MDRIDALIDAYLDRHLTPEQAQQLSVWLSADREHALHFARQAMLHRALRDDFSGAGSRSLLELNHNLVVQGPDDSQVWERLLQVEEASEPVLADLPILPESSDVDAPAPVVDDRRAHLLLSLPGLRLYRSVRRGDRSGGARRALRVAAMVALVVGTVWYVRPRGTAPSPPEAPLATPASAPAPMVARLVQSYAAQWDRPVEPGQRFRAGDRIELTRGYAQWRLERGASVIMQGPCTLTFRDDNAVRLHQGRLVAQVPPDAIGFAVQTPKAILVDHGTEFGVTVDDTGRMEATVFDGAVTLSNAQEVADASETRLVVAGWSGRLSGDGTIEVVARDQWSSGDNYVRRLSMSPYRMQVYLMNPQAYWTFSDIRREVVLNHYDSAHLAGVHQSVAPIAFEKGPIAQEDDTQALALSDGAYLDFGDVLDFDRHDAFSFALWLRPASEVDAAVLSRMDIAKPHRGYDIYLSGMHIGLQLKHSFYVRPHNAVRVMTQQPLKADEWVHLVVTYDGTSRASGVRIYINGEPAAVEVRDDSLTDTIRTTAPFRLGRRTDTSQSNQLLTRTDAEGVRHFDGAVDELMVFRRVVDEEEVWALYQSFPLESAEPDGR